MICRSFNRFFQKHATGFVPLPYQPKNNDSSGGHPACRRAVASSPAEETSRTTKRVGDFVSR